ncbi:YIP1 family protein [Candidatus Woesearchaeota archaeon]|nr:YIP1 family protein [Candidatus Woesearchaeota archaeon]
MLNRTIKIIKEVFTNPSEFFVGVRREKSINNVLIFFLIMTLFYIIVTVPSIAIQNSMLLGLGEPLPPFLLGAFATIFYAAMMFIASFVTLFIFAAILHIGVYFMKGKGGIRETIKAYGYAQAPSFVFGGIISYLMISEVTALFALVPVVVI